SPSSATRAPSASSSSASQTPAPPIFLPCRSVLRATPRQSSARGRCSSGWRPAGEAFFRPIREPRRAAQSDLSRHCPFGLVKRADFRYRHRGEPMRMRYISHLILPAVLGFGLSARTAGAADEQQFPLGGTHLQLAGGTKAASRRFNFSGRWSGAVG